MTFFERYRRKLQHKISGIITLKPKLRKGEKVKGRVLLSYLTMPFLLTEGEMAKVPHTNYWECREMANAFLDKGYIVDVIYWKNTKFIPKKKYDAVVDLYLNLSRLSPLLPQECKKVMFIDAAHWEFQNSAETKRINDLYLRRGTRVKPQRQMDKSKNIEVADFVVGLGNEFTFGTYAFANKKIHPLHLSTITTFPSPAGKDFDKIRKNFIWIGGGGAVHKGLDLVLECFKDLPDYTLTICGPVQNETDFLQVYHKELFENPRIKMTGRINVREQQFKEIVQNSLALIYPSSSEGQSGSVITALHAGLIPIISYQCGVSANTFGGIILNENTMEEIKKEVTNLSSLPASVLKEKAVASWSYANNNHTRENFSKEWKAFLNSILK